MFISRNVAMLITFPLTDVVSNSLCPTLRNTPLTDKGTEIMLTPMLESSCELANTSRHFPEDAAEILSDTYDVVVVGAGSSGSIVAARLSENTDWKVIT